MKKWEWEKLAEDQEREDKSLRGQNRFHDEAPPHKRLGEKMCRILYTQLTPH